MARAGDLETRLGNASPRLEVATPGVSDTAGHWLRALPYFVSGSAWWSQNVSYFPYLAFVLSHFGVEIELTQRHRQAGTIIRYRAG
jgi:hypothetical protein